MVAVTVGVEPLVVAVVVLIYNGVLILGVDLVHVGVELRTIGCRSGCGYDYNVRILGLHLVIYDVKTLPELRSLVFVTYAQILEVEGLGVSHIGTQLAPLGICAAVTELDEVKGVVHEYVVETLAVSLGLKGSNVLVACKLAGYAVVEYGQGSCSK